MEPTTLPQQAPTVKVLPDAIVKTYKAWQKAKKGSAKRRIAFHYFATACQAHGRAIHSVIDTLA